MVWRGCPSALRMIIEAYEVLRDPRSRADYDRRQEGVEPQRRAASRGGADQGFICAPDLFDGTTSAPSPAASGTNRH